MIKKYIITEEQIGEINSFMNMRSLLSAKEVLKNLPELKSEKKKEREITKENEKEYLVRINHYQNQLLTERDERRREKLAILEFLNKHCFYCVHKDEMIREFHLEETPNQQIKEEKKANVQPEQTQ